MCFLVLLVSDDSKSLEKFELGVTVFPGRPKGKHFARGLSSCSYFRVRIDLPGYINFSDMNCFFFKLGAKSLFACAS